MEFPASFNKIPENETLKEKIEFISIPALETLAKSLVGHYDIDSFVIVANEFLETENKLNSNTKKKLYNKFKNEVLKTELDKHIQNLNILFDNVKNTVEKILSNTLDDKSKNQLRSIFHNNLPSQKLEDIEQKLTSLEKIGIENKELHIKIQELNKIIESEEYLNNQGAIIDND